MKTMLSLFLLVGMSPGAILPSSITDQLIAPSAPENESKSGNKEGSADTNSSRNKDVDPSKETDSIQVIPSTYSAIRPTGFQFTKGDFRTILTPVECPLSKVFCLVGLMMACQNDLPPYPGVMELDYCDALEVAVTSPDISPHAPPDLS